MFFFNSKSKEGIVVSWQICTVHTYNIVTVVEEKRKKEKTGVCYKLVKQCRYFLIYKIEM